MRGDPCPHDDVVFILYAVLAGLLLGLVSRGSPARLGDLRFRWAPLIAFGMLIQVALFSSPLGNALGEAAAPVYVVSNLAVLLAVGANLALPGLWLVLAGGASNLLAIVGNSGYMPVSPEAMAAMGGAPKEGYSNSVASDAVNMAPLTDIFTMPAWVPMANVFSVGDMLIGVGAAIAVIAAMHGRGPLVARSGSTEPAPA